MCKNIWKWEKKVVHHISKIRVGICMQHHETIGECVCVLYSNIYVYTFMYERAWWLKCVNILQGYHNHVWCGFLLFLFFFCVHAKQIIKKLKTYTAGVQFDTRYVRVRSACSAKRGYERIIKSLLTSCYIVLDLTRLYSCDGRQKGSKSTSSSKVCRVAFWVFYQFENIFACAKTANRMYSLICVLTI